MATKQINGRIILKHDTEENWLKATGFVPQAGEMVIYDTDEANSECRVKVGDGSRNVNDLPFLVDYITNDEIDEICGASIVEGSEVLV